MNVEDVESPDFCDAIERLRIDYERDHNPTYVWNALVLHFACGEPLYAMPTWIEKYLVQSGEAIMTLYLDPEGRGSVVEREAQTVGKALGFGASGKGGTSQFEAAHLLERDRDLHALVQELIEKGDKPYLAHETVGKRTGWGKDVVRHACDHIANITSPTWSGKSPTE